MDRKPITGGGGSFLGESGPLYTIIYPMKPLAQGGTGTSDSPDPPPRL